MLGALDGEPTESIDLDPLLRLRLVVARYGEMDRAGWWNTNGMLGRYGAIVLERGFRGRTASPRRASSSLLRARGARSSSTRPAR